MKRKPIVNQFPLHRKGLIGNGAWFIVLLACTPHAQAHVKWFARDATASSIPLAPELVVSHPFFLLMALLSLTAMALAGLVDQRLSRRNGLMQTWVTYLDKTAAKYTAIGLRWSLSAFFAVCILFYGDAPVYLTPELHAHNSLVGPLQTLIVITLLSRRTAWLGALGIALLYMGAVMEYGWFHLLDYPIFLGAAAFIALDTLSAGMRLDKALALLRLATGITLMWASAEKWFYPWWSYTMLDQQLAGLRGGLPQHSFMIAAGFVEFCCAYALLFGRVSVQLAAWALLLPFLAAIPVFGEIDAIGHAPILAVLIVLGLTRTRLSEAWHGGDGLLGALRHASQCLMLAMAVTGLYWLGHVIAYQLPGDLHASQYLLVGVLLLPTIIRLSSLLRQRLYLRRVFQDVQMQ